MAELAFLPASGHFTVEQALESAKLHFPDATDVVIIGYDKDGEMFTRSSHMSVADAVFLLESAKLHALGK